MKTIQFLALLFFCTLIIHSETLLASGATSDRQTRSISGFHGVSVSSGIDLYLTQKSTEEVSVEAESQDLDKIITEVEGGVLKIYIKEKSWFNMKWNSKPRKVYVSFISLDRIEASAGSDVVSQSALKLDKVKIDVSSGSDVKLEIEATEISVQTSSGSDVSLKGKSIYLQADASSGSDINAGDLEVKKCNASASSGSDVRINVNEELSANASSGGDITYSGNPAKKDINESSGGDVTGR